MIRSNYHIHSNYCDGKNTVEEMVISAIDAGLLSIGFSSHAPVPFQDKAFLSLECLESYFQTILRLKQKYASKIEIYTGLEIDYFMDQNEIASSEKIRSQLDYSIMSIHSLGSTKGEPVFFIDFTQENFVLGLKKYYHGDAKLFVEDYYRGISKMVLKYQPTILGHLDLIKKYNQNNFFFNEEDDWYRQAVKTCLDAIAASGVILEINTGAYLRVSGVGRYPSDWMLPEILKRKIPITVSGDSHSVEGIVTKFEETENLLIQNGYKEYWSLVKGQWKPLLLDS